MKLPIALTALALFATARAATYTVTDLGSTYVVNGFQGKVINDAGQVIANDIGPDAHGFLYSGSMWNDLGHLNSSGMGSHGMIARGLNNAGRVVGQGDTGAAAQAEAVFRDGVGGALTALGLVTAANQDAIGYGCNNLGIIVGNVIDSGTGTRDTFLFKPGTGLISRTTDGVYSFAINQFGDVLGMTAGLVVQPVLNGTPLSASTAGFTPMAINNAGQILLSANDTHPINGAWALIYDYSTGKTKPLPNLHPNSGGYTVFFDINDAGHVVGRGSDENLAPHAVLYTPTGGLISLDALGLTSGGDAIHLTEAHGINNAGQIVCLGYTTDPDVLHAYLLTPDAPQVLPLAATYDGLADGPYPDIGSVSITVGKGDTFSVKMKTPMVSHAFTGKLTNGAFSGPVTVKGVTLTVNLQADAARHKITGTITNANGPYDVTALRQMKLGVFAGKLTALLQIPGPPNSSLPQGIGFGQMSVSKTGAIKMNGRLGDATKYAVTAKLHIDGTWTFFAPLYAKDAQKGGLTGTITFNRAAPDSDCSGTLQWIRPTAFDTAVTLKAAFFKAVKDTQLLRFTNTSAGAAAFAFDGGQQMLPAHTLSVSSKNVVSVTDPTDDALAVKLATSTGVLSGSFIHPASNKKTTFTGVLQQKLNLGGGVFMGQTLAGSVLLTPQ